MEFDARVKGFALAADLLKMIGSAKVLANPTTDFSGDLRLMLNKTVGSLQFQLHHSSLLQAGDTAVGARCRRTSRPDDRDGCSSTVGYDLANRLGRRHQWGHRIDRMSVQWQQADWSVTLGRQAVSWGSGIVFQPLDPLIRLHQPLWIETTRTVTTWCW